MDISFTVLICQGVRFGYLDNSKIFCRWVQVSEFRTVGLCSPILGQHTKMFRILRGHRGVGVLPIRLNSGWRFFKKWCPLWTFRMGYFILYSGLICPWHLFEITSLDLRYVLITKWKKLKWKFCWCSGRISYFRIWGVKVFQNWKATGKADNETLSSLFHKSTISVCEGVAFHDILFYFGRGNESFIGLHENDTMI